MTANILLGLIFLCVAAWVVASLRDTWDDVDLNRLHEHKQRGWWR